MFTPPRLLVLLALALSSAPAADRVAFVIGVDTYDHLAKDAQLEVAVEDAERMAATLRKLDPPFDVTLLTDAKQDAAEEAYDEFLDAASGAECALVYFAGHGIEYFGTNYLIVRDTAVDSESADVERMKRRLGNEALSLQAMVDSLDATGAKVKLVVLDCCRDNPLEAATPSGTRSTLGGRSGLAQVTPPSGTLISYSADAGQKANDGLFTAVLIDQIENSGLPLPEVFASTRVKVREISTKWAAEDAAKGLPPEYRRVRHEPAEYVKLDPAAYRFRFSKGVPSEGKVEESPETVALRQQVEAMKKTIEELRKAGVENDALKEQVANMEATVAAGTKTPETPSAPTMVRTDSAPSGGFAASRSMEGSKAGEVREFGGIEMVWCPPGTFLMGSPESEEGREDDETQHEVTLTRGFWMAKTECTQEQWESVMGDNPSEFTGPTNLPVEQVSWEDVVEWTTKMNDRHPLPDGWRWTLPTEAQWEYACRAGTAGAYAGELDAMAWYQDNSGATTHEVGRKKGNPWGLYDMHGNVNEFCADWYGDYPSGAVTDPTGAADGPGRVLRGGCWYFIAHACRSANRGGSYTDLELPNLGFRPAVSYTP